MINNILAFLNPAIGTYLASKGLSKIDPRLGKFFSGAAATGYTVDQAIGFLRDKLTPEGQKAVRAKLQQGRAQGTLRPDQAGGLEGREQASAPYDVAQKAAAIGAGGVGGVLGALAPEPQAAEAEAQALEANQPPNPIAAHPELFKVAEQEIFGGRPIQETAQLLRSNMKFRKIVAQLEQESGITFEDILNGLFGAQGAAKGGQPGPQAQPGPQGQGNEGKSQFLQGLAALQQSLAAMKGNR